MKKLLSIRTHVDLRTYMLPVFLLQHTRWLTYASSP